MHEIIHRTSLNRRVIVSYVYDDRLYDIIQDHVEYATNSLVQMCIPQNVEMSVHDGIKEVIFSHVRSIIHDQTYGEVQV